MRSRFNPRSHLVVIRARVFGPDGDVALRLAIDTGSSLTLIHPNRLLVAGYDLTRATTHVTLATANGFVGAPVVDGVGLAALGRRASGTRIVAHSLHRQAGIDGVLGLDFFRGRRLTLDFAAGIIDFE